MTVDAFAAFSDECSPNEGRFRTIAAVSLPADRVVSVRSEFASILASANATELKWTKLEGGLRTRCARELLAAVVRHAADAVLRVDVIVWDTHDIRHAVAGRDDLANFERMFFHLHKSVFRRRALGSQWHVRPDRNVSIDWATLKSCLNADGTWKNHALRAFAAEELNALRPSIATFREVESSEAPLCQVADLFAGMVHFTASKPQVIRALMQDVRGQQSLFEVGPKVATSRRDRDRFPVIWDFYQMCRAAGIAVSLEESGVLRTFDPKQPINCWHYVPQHGQDRAPVKDC